MAILPDSMRDLSGASSEQKINALIDYIQYMKDRLEFYETTVNRRLNNMESKINKEKEGK